MKPFLFVVACALFNEKKELLITQRPPGKSFAGLWEFPGGKKESHETPEAALIRELREELAIEVNLKDLQPLSFASHEYDSFHLFMPLYQCFSYRGCVTPMEGQAYRFIAPTALKNFPLVPADIVFLPLFCPDQPMR